MFIHRVSNANRVDKWYDRRNRILTPRLEDTSCLINYDFEAITKYFYKTFNGTDTLDKMLKNYNPVYIKEDGCLIRALSVIMALEYFEIEPGLYDLLIELEL